MINYKLNKKGIEFIKNCLNEHHVDSVNGEWLDGEFDSAIDFVESDVNFMANGNIPEYCKDKPKFHIMACESASGEPIHIEMEWDMFEQSHCEVGDRG